MEKQVEEKNTEMGSVITRSEEFIQKNQKNIIICIAVVLVIVLAVFGLRKWYFQPREVRAAEEMFAAEQWFAQGDYEKALNGDDTFRGFLSVIDSYGCTKAGNLAKYYAGVCQLNLGKYNEAIDLLKSYKGKDLFTGSQASMLIGDAYAEMENPSEAVKYYEKAAKGSDNFIVAPTALWKAGMMYLQLNDKESAIKAFRTIKEKFPESPEYVEADKYISYTESL